MKGKRKIFLDPELARAAVGSKESLEALAIVLGVKITFISSVVTNATAVRLMHIFGIGHARYKRAVGYALEKGWLVREGDNIRAAKIKRFDAYNIPLTFDKHYGKQADDVRCPYTMTKLCNIIRSSIIVCHISKQIKVFDTTQMATHPPKRTSQAKYKAAVKRVEGWGMRKPKLKRKANRLSYARMSELAGCSKSKAKSLVKSLVGGGVINKIENYEKTRWHIDEYSRMLRDNYAATGRRGFIVRHDGKVMLRLANSYTLNKVVVKYLTSDRKKLETA